MGLIFEKEPQKNLRKKSVDEIEELYKANYKKNRNNTKMIDVLPILVDIAENQFLIKSAMYQEEAKNQENYLPSCGSKVCEYCLEDTEKCDSKILEEFNNSLA